MERKFNVYLQAAYKPVEHKGQKRKLLLAENGTIYKVKRSKMEKSVKAEQYV